MTDIICAQRGPYGVLGTVEKEMVERRHSRTVLDKAEENEERADRAEKPAQRVDGQGWAVQYRCWTSHFRRHALHCERSQRTPFDTVCASSTADGALWPSGELPALPAISKPFAATTPTPSVARATRSESGSPSQQLPSAHSLPERTTTITFTEFSDASGWPTP